MYRLKTHSISSPLSPILVSIPAAPRRVSGDVPAGAGAGAIAAAGGVWLNR